MENYLDEFSMRQASIFELRNLARDMGVNSPTIYKKEELIEKILKIANGEEKPQMPKSRQGRPPKKMHSYNEEKGLNFLRGLSESDSYIVSNSNLPKQDFDKTSFNSSWVLACPNTFKYESSQDSNSFCYEEREGYLKIMEDATGFIFQKGRCANPDTAVFVSAKTICEDNLRNGDLIKCVCKKVVANEKRYLAEIKTVNNIPFKSHKELDRLNFDNIDICTNCETNLFEKNQEINIFDNIKQGSRNIIKCKNLKEYFKILKNITLQNTGCKVIGLCIEVLPEQEGLLKFEPNTEVFYTMYGDMERQNNITIDLAVERVKRICEQNESVIFVVNEIGKLIKFQNFSLGNEAYDIKYKSLNNVYKVLSLARKFQDKNVTVISMFKDSVFSQNLFKIEEEFDNFDCNIIKIN